MKEAAAVICSKNEEIAVLLERGHSRNVAASIDAKVRLFEEKCDDILDLIWNMKRQGADTEEKLQLETANKERQRARDLATKKERLHRGTAAKILELDQKEEARDKELREALVGVATLHKAVIDSRKAVLAKDRQAYRKKLDAQPKGVIQSQLDKRWKENVAYLDERYQKAEEKQRQEHAAIEAAMLEHQWKREEFAKSELD